MLDKTPFSEGGRRQCYFHPEFGDRCIKVRRPDRPLEYLRERRSFPKNKMPLSSFDDSLEEFRTMKKMDAKYGEPLYAHVSRCFGFEKTDMGEGLVCELVKDHTGEVSLTLRQFIEQSGYTEECKKIVEEFSEFWRKNVIPYRGNFRLENLVVQQGENGSLIRLVAIDDIGHASSVPLPLIPKFYRQRKSNKKVDILHQRIDALVKRLAE